MLTRVNHGHSAPIRTIKRARGGGLRLGFCPSGVTCVASGDVSFPGWDVPLRSRRRRPVPKGAAVARSRPLHTSGEPWTRGGETKGKILSGSSSHRGQPFGASDQNRPPRGWTRAPTQSPPPPRGWPLKPPPRGLPLPTRIGRWGGGTAPGWHRGQPAAAPGWGFDGRGADRAGGAAARGPWSSPVSPGRLC